MPENEGFIGVLNVNGKIYFAEGATQEEVEGKLAEPLELARTNYRERADWENSVEVYRAEKVPLKTIGPDIKKR